MELVNYNEELKGTTYETIFYLSEMHITVI
jgi:hypothetical protein